MRKILVFAAVVALPGASACGSPTAAVVGTPEAAAMDVGNGLGSGDAEDIGGTLGSGHRGCDPATDPLCP